MNAQRILIVEDDPDYQNELLRALRELHVEHQTTVAGDLESGLERIRDDRFELCIVDLKLGGNFRGFDFIGELRKNPLNSTCNVIVLSGYPTTERIISAFQQYTVRRFISKKKYDPDEFRAAV